MILGHVPSSCCSRAGRSSCWRWSRRSSRCAGGPADRMKRAALAAPRSAAAAGPCQRALEHARWVVWLLGIGSVPGERRIQFEVQVPAGAARSGPNVVIVDDAFAYSVRDNPLAGKQLLDAGPRPGAQAWSWQNQPTAGHHDSTPQHAPGRGLGRWPIWPDFQPRTGRSGWQATLSRAA